MKNQYLTQKEFKTAVEKTTQMARSTVEADKYISVARMEGIAKGIIGRPAIDAWEVTYDAWKQLTGKQLTAETIGYKL